MRRLLTPAMACLWLLLFFNTTTSAIPYPIIDAAKRGDENAVRKLLALDPTLAGEQDEQGYTPLHWAGIRGHWFCFKHLINAEAPVNTIGGDGGTALHWACHHNRTDMIQLLLDAGADLSVANRWGRTALHVAVRRGNSAVVSQLLAAGADINAATREGWTPLHVAYLAGHKNVPDLLLQAGADPDLKDSEDKKPVEYRWQRPEPIELDPARLAEYVGIYDLGGGYAFKIWPAGDGLAIQEFAPDQLYPIGVDQFYCVSEPWRVTFKRDESGAVSAVDVDFLRRTVTGHRRQQAHYIGSQSCRQCHGRDESGNQYLQWIRSRHGAAYWRLATDWASLLAGFRPAFCDLTDPLTDRRCLLCHTTIAQDPEALTDNSYRLAEGVGCECCHGPGSRYATAEVMSDRERFLAAGGLIPDESTCLRCHRNPDNFDYSTWLPKVDHSNPEGDD